MLVSCPLSSSSKEIEGIFSHNQFSAPTEIILRRYPNVINSSTSKDTYINWLASNTPFTQDVTSSWEEFSAFQNESFKFCKVVTYEPIQTKTKHEDKSLFAGATACISEHEELPRLNKNRVFQSKRRNRRNQLTIHMISPYTKVDAGFQLRSALSGVPYYSFRIHRFFTDKYSTISVESSNRI